MRKRLSDEEFFDALTELFLAEGYTGLTVGEMAARLKCSRRRLYAIAQTKEDIFCAMVERLFRDLVRQGEAAARSTDDLPAAIAAYLQVGVVGGSRLSVQFLKDIEDSDRFRGIFDEYQRIRSKGLSALIDEGARKGVFVPCHGFLVSEVMLGAAMRLRRPAFHAETGLTLEEAFQEFYRLMLGGLLADEPVKK